MFCPVCQAEYREGFTRCTDCDIPLVESIAGDQPKAEMQGLALAWRGSDPTAFSAALAALKDAGISSYEISDHDQLAWELAAPKPGYRIMVKKMDLAAAHDLVAPFGERAAWAHARDIWKGSNEFQHVDQENLQEVPSEIPSPEEDAPDDILAELDPKDATSEVWSGEQAMALTVRDCLRENGIDCVLIDGGEARRVRVAPKFEARAKEIIREIIEATPPQ